MTTTLQNIIEKCDAIISEANQLGFVNVNIHNDRVNESESISELTLVVTVDPENSKAHDFYATHLAASLRKMLVCDVAIMVHSRIKPLYTKHIKMLSAPIEDREAITKLFHTTQPEKITFADPPENNQIRDLRPLSNVERIKKNLSKTDTNKSDKKEINPHSEFNPKKHQPPLLFCLK
jgi:hypothetical protein